MQLLAERHAVVWQEAVGRISYQTDDRFRPVQPYQLALARDDLERDGDISVEHTETPSLVTLQLSAMPPQYAKRDWARLPGRRRAEYMPHRRWVSTPQIVGGYAEKVLMHSLRHYAQGRLLVRDRSIGNVTKVDGAEIGHGQSLDLLAYVSSPVMAEGPPTLTPLIFESKNVYEWLYPWRPEPWELLVKAARLAVQQVPVVPVLACVRSGFQLTKMASDLGFMVAWYHEQMVNPERVDETELHYLRDALGLAIRLQPREIPVPGVGDFVSLALGEVRNPTTNRSTFMAELASFRFKHVAPVVLEYAQDANFRPRPLSGDRLRAFAQSADARTPWEFKGGWFQASDE